MARLADMDGEGIDRAVLYPSVGLYFWALDDPGAAVAIARAYNDWLATYCAADPDRLFGAAMVPVQDPAGAAAEVRRAHDELGFPAAFVRPNPCCGRSLSDPAYEPIWTAAEEIGMTIGVHEGSSVIVPTLGFDRPFNPLILHAVSHAFEEMLACAQLIAFGVLERHPGLRVVFLESSGGWVPFWMERLDEQAESFGGFCPQMRLAPSEYFARQCWISYEIDERDAARPRPFHRRRTDRLGVGLPASRRHLPRSGGDAATDPGPARRRQPGPDPRSERGQALPAAPVARDVTDGTLLGSIVREAGVRYADTAVYVAPQGTTLSYAELDSLSDQVAGGLARRGIGAGDLVGLLLPSGPAFTVAYVAAAKIGAVTAGVNDRLSPPERRRCLEIARPRLVIASGDLAATTDVATLDGGVEVVEVDTEADTADTLGILRTPGPAPPAARGRPRPGRGRGLHLGDDGRAQGGGVLRTANSTPSARPTGDGGGADGGRGLSSTSFAHLGYMTKLPQALRGGGTSFLMGRWSAGGALEMVARHRITHPGRDPHPDGAHAGPRPLRRRPTSRRCGSSPWEGARRPPPSCARPAERSVCRSWSATPAPRRGWGWARWSTTRPRTPRSRWAGPGPGWS